MPTARWRREIDLPYLAPCAVEWVAYKHRGGASVRVEDPPVAPMKRPSAAHPYLAGTVSLDQLARRWHSSRKEIRHLLATQQLCFVQINSHLRVPQDEVDRYERQGGPPGRFR